MARGLSPRKRAALAEENARRVARGEEPWSDLPKGWLSWHSLTREEKNARVAEYRSHGDGKAGRKKWHDEWERLVKLGLVTGFPNRLFRGQGDRTNAKNRETLVERARKEIAWMKDLDERFEEFKASHPEAEVPGSNGDRFRSLTNKSMDVFDKILSADIPMAEGSEKLIREQREAAAVTIRIGARVALEMYRGQSIGALEALLIKIREAKGLAVDETPQLIEGEVIEGEVADP